MAENESQPTKPQPPPMIGSYRLVEPLGSGGMSSVFRARHSDTNHEVAVKVLPRYLAKNATLLHRFLREARSAEALEDPNIVAIFDHGAENGRHYLVLEYVPGGDLHDFVRKHGPMAILEAVDAIRQVCRGLRHAAGRGLIHRDIKPANILRTPEGVVKITDLGLALHIEDEDERVTRDGTTVGTVDYMSPEQARDSRATSLKSDMYSLGCTFYFLVTGQAPFAGGDVAEKLRSHATEPAPDARLLRPDTPEILARLIRKMMAKKPDGRYADYDRLIDALDAVAAAIRGGTSEVKAEPLYALIDDDEDEAGDIPIAADPAAPLYALIDDDDEEEEKARFTLGAGSSAPGGSTVSTHALADLLDEAAAVPGPPVESSLADVNLGALAGIEEQSTSTTPPRRPEGRPGLAVPTTDMGRSQASPLPRPRPVDDLPIPPDPYGLEEPTVRSEVDAVPISDIPVLNWLLRLGIAAGLVLIVAMAWPLVAPRLIGDGATSGSPGVDETDNGFGGPSVPDAKKIPPWIEPGESAAATRPEPPPPTDQLVKLGIADASEEASHRAEAPFVEVRRIDVFRDRDHVAELRLALDTVGGTATLADDGPFFEQDFRFAGNNKVIRGESRYRPVVVLKNPSLDSVRTLPAVFDLDGDRSLVVEGVDFVIQAERLGPRQNAVFRVRRGANLTLRDCSITIVGPLPHPLAVIQIGEPAVAGTPPECRVRVERSTIRGTASVGLAWMTSANVLLARSALVVDGGPAVAISGGETPTRKLAFFRSSVVSRGPIVEVSGSAGSASAPPPVIRASQSSFARIEGESAASLIGLREIPAGPARTAPVVDWRGEENQFLGWSSWSLASPPGLLAGLHGGSPESDLRSEAADPAASKILLDPWVSIDRIPFGTQIPARFAQPAPFLKEKSVGRFERGPEISLPASGSVRSLSLDLGDPTTPGDLGKLLQEAVGRQPGRVQVRVRGKGDLSMSPVRMPDGVSLELIVEPNPPGVTPLTLTASEGTAGEGLIAVRNADLIITGMRMSRVSRTFGLKSLLAVDHGNIDLRGCILTGPGEVETGGGGLIRFRTDGTRPYPEVAEPARQSAAGLPRCRLLGCILITGGDAVVAEVGRGRLELTDCALATGGVGFTLQPQDVRHDRFLADLWLDRCTMASEQAMVKLGSWPGAAAGPDRPWVVSSRSSAFLDLYDRKGAPSTSLLLRVDPASLAQGGLIWQSEGDLYDLSHFAAGGEAPPPTVSRNDVQRQWIDLWGTSHIRDPQGNRGKAGESVLAFRNGKLHPGDVEPDDLILGLPPAPGASGPAIGADVAKIVNGAGGVPR